MSAMRTLTESERRLFALVTEAAFVNPFSLNRATLDHRLGGKSEAGLSGALQNVRQGLDRLRQRGDLVLSRYTAADSRVLLYAHLFDVFHRWAPEFDRLITRQERETGESVQVSFGSEVMSQLLTPGIAPGDAIRFIGMFYQLRRAFYFIRRELVGSSPSMRALRTACWNNIFTHDLSLYLDALVTRMEDFSTLLLGETGSGKGAVARAIGVSGFIPYDPKTGRFAENFAASLISLNLAQFPESLMEAELFGHRKGAFTGAIADREGAFARCRPHGAIFLDEIGDVPLPVQIKLLQVLQERTFTPVGSDMRRRFAGRVIAATNRPLDELRQKGDFRQDFYYRLCSDVIKLPPLRVRLAEDCEELGRLVAVILDRHLGPDPAVLLLPRVMESLAKSPGLTYVWPGNVRELEQAVRRILLTGNYTPELIVSGITAREPWLDRAAAGELSADWLMAQYCQMLWNRLGSYEDVARRTGLDRRTVKKYITLIGVSP
jgi:DNA-binding NtrC family response regulator